MFTTNTTDFSSNDSAVFTMTGENVSIGVYVTNDTTPYIFISDSMGSRIVVPFNWSQFDLTKQTTENLNSPDFNIWSFGAQGQTQHHKAPYIPTTDDIKELCGSWNAEPYTPPSPISNMTGVWGNLVYDNDLNAFYNLIYDNNLDPVYIVYPLDENAKNSYFDEPEDECDEDEFDE